MVSDRVTAKYHLSPVGLCGRAPAQFYVPCQTMAVQRSCAFVCCPPIGGVSSHNQPSAPAWKTSASMSRSSFLICTDPAAGDSTTRSVARFTELVSAAAINVLSTSMSRRINPGTCEFLIAKMTHLMKFGVKKLNLQK